MSTFVFATTSTMLHDANGIAWRVDANSPWDADDPLVRRHPGHFSPTPIVVGRTVKPVEQATRSPGELRPSAARAPGRVRA